MPSFLIYEWKVASALLVFYLFYRFLLRKETFHRFNRVVLVGTMLLSFIMPFCIITIHKPMEMAPAEFEAVRAMGSDMAAAMAPGAGALNSGSLGAAAGTPGSAAGALQSGLLASVAGALKSAPDGWWWLALTILFAAGAAFVLSRVLMSILSVVRIIRRGECVSEEGGCKIIVTDREIDPFSWMRYIVLSRRDWEGPHSPIITHERAHIDYGHSAELLLVDILSAFQWFNPAVWMLRSDLQELHEYEADDAVLRSGANIKEYQYLLIRKAVSKSGYSVANSFNHSILKNRITMMSKSKSPLARGLRALYLLPLVCLGLGLQAQTVYVPTGEDSEKNVSQETKQKDGTFVVLNMAADGTVDTGADSFKASDMAAIVAVLKAFSPGLTVVINADPATPMSYVDNLKKELWKFETLKIHYTTPAEVTALRSKLQSSEPKVSRAETTSGYPAEVLPGANRENICVALLNENDKIFFDDGAYQDDAIILYHGKNFLEKHGNASHFMLRYNLASSYGAYLHLQSLILQAYSDVRNEKARALYGKDFEELAEEESAEIRRLIPISISEAEPRG